MGPTGGGMFKTENCGETWTPVTDGQISTGSIGAIDVSESNPNVVYVGTGSAAIRSNVIIGRGAYKSTDAGRTWQFIGLRDAGQIGSIVIHPTNPDVVWAAALGSPFGPNDERGVFKTTDGGKTWKKTLFVNNETGARVLAVNMSNPNELYAGMYRGFRKGWDIISGGPATEGGIYKSTDGGDTWKKLEAGLPAPLIGKIDIDVARSQPNIVYAMVEAPGEQGGLYRSDDSGATWRLVNNAGEPRSRPFYFNYVDVNPKNPDEVWVNALGLYKSTDGGKQFTTVSTPHGDNHGIWFNPDNPLDGDPGATTAAPTSRATAAARGRASSTSRPPSSTWSASTSSTRTALRSAAGQLDRRGAERAARVVRLRQPGAGVDAGVRLRDRRHLADAGRQGDLGRVQGRSRALQRRDRPVAGPLDLSAEPLRPPPEGHQVPVPAATVVFVSPHDPKVVYQASHVVHRTRDEGVTWQVISPDLTWNDPKYRSSPASRSPATSPARKCTRPSTRWRSRRSSTACSGRRQRRSGPRVARRRQDMEERHAEGPAARRARAEHRCLAARKRVAPTSPSTDISSGTTSSRTSIGPTTTARPGRG